MTDFTSIIQVGQLKTKRSNEYIVGHGTRNTTIQFNKDTFSRKLAKDGYETVHAAKEDSVSYGDCMVGLS